jgi:hypothetical protein
MEEFISGVTASLVAGTLLWTATHHKEVTQMATVRRRRTQLSGAWYSYHLSRDSMSGRGPLWVRHEDILRVSLLGRVGGVSRAQHGRNMTYRVSGYVRGPTLRLYLDNRDAHESQTSLLYPNLLPGDVLVGLLMGEDFDRQWYASPSIMSREPLSEARLTVLARQLRLNRPSQQAGSSATKSAFPEAEGHG